MKVKVLKRVQKLLSRQNTFTFHFRAMKLQSALSGTVTKWKSELHKFIEFLRTPRSGSISSNFSIRVLPRLTPRVRVHWAFSKRQSTDATSENQFPAMSADLPKIAPFSIVESSDCWLWLSSLSLEPFFAASVNTWYPAYLNSLQNSLFAAKSW